MKNIKKIKKAVAAMDLIGVEYRRELESQCLAFGRELISLILVEVEDSEPDIKNVLIYFAHFTEIFMTAEKEGFTLGFAENLQREVFAVTFKHTDSICEWRDHLFGDSEQTESETEKPDKSQEIESTALLISNLLHDPNLPTEIYDVLVDALDDSRHVNKSEINAFHTSPEYVAMVLRAHNK